MAKIKKAQVGVKAKASKDSVPSEMFPGKMIPKSAVRKGAYITVDKPAPKKKMKDGGSLKAVPADKEKSLGKLPTPVRNKMGFQKNGGKMKAKSGASMKKCEYGCK